MLKNGGITMIAKTAIAGDKTLLKEFFEAIKDVPAQTDYSDVMYFGVPVPRILIDSIFDLDKSDTILNKINRHLDETASWWSRNGYKAIAEMTFATKLQPQYRKYNEQNVALIKILHEAGIRVHCLGNCSAEALHLVMEEHGKIPFTTICTSAHLQEMKCSSGHGTAIYNQWLNRTFNIDLKTTLFLEVEQGYVDSVRRWNADANVMLYRGQGEKEAFIAELAEYLGQEFTFDDIKARVKQDQEDY